MAILAGIDEAGLGPLLGPLVVSTAAFRVPENALDTCLWKTLRATCTDKPAKSARKLAITDSKKLHKSREDIAALERTALVMLATTDRSPDTLAELMEQIAPGTTQSMTSYPWYANTAAPVPTDQRVGDVLTRANALRRNMGENGVTFLGPTCAPLLEGEYNRLIGGTRNKAVVLMGQALKLIDHIARIAPDEDIAIFVDRLGGRTHYREAIQTAFPEYELFVLTESPERSAYRLNGRARHIRIEFRPEGESRHFATALASIYSKYVRELFMRLFNEYWCAHDKELKPTAGYYTDAERWLTDAKALIERLRINREQLIRVR